MFSQFQMMVESRPNSPALASARASPSRWTRVEPPANMSTVSADLTDGHFTARFADSTVQAGAAHTSRFFKPPMGTIYTPFKTKDFAFSNTTVEMVESLGDKAFSTVLDASSALPLSRASSHPNERPAKRNCIRKDKKSLRLSEMRKKLCKMHGV